MSLMWSFFIIGFSIYSSNQVFANLEDAGVPATMARSDDSHTSTMIFLHSRSHRHLAPIQ